MRKIRPHGFSKIVKRQNRLKIRVLDDTGITDPKRILIHVNNLNDDGEDTVIWKDVITVDGSSFVFHPSAPIGIQAQILSSPIMETRLLHTTMGEQYHFVDGEFALESTGHGTSTIVNNDNNSGVIVNVTRDGDIMLVKTLDDEEEYDFRIRPTFYIQALDDLEAEGDPDDANTEIGLLGVLSATVLVTKTGENPYQFTLTDVVYA